MLFHRNRNLLRHHRRVVGDVEVIAEDQLERVRARRQGQGGLGLPFAEVPDGVGSGKRQPYIRHRIDIDEQVVMAGVLHLDARRRDAHSLQAELHRKRGADGFSVCGGDDIAFLSRQEQGMRCFLPSHSAQPLASVMSHEARLRLAVMSHGFFSHDP